MRLEHHLVGGYVRYISPYIIIIIIIIILIMAGNWQLNYNQIAKFIYWNRMLKLLKYIK